MKTSTKILLALLVALFMVPTVFFMAYSYKLKHTDLKRYDEDSNWNRFDIGPSRFIKIAGPDKGVLDCKLSHSEDPHYKTWRYGQGGDDSVRVHQQQDTLFINYISIASSNNHKQYHRTLEIFVSEWQHLQVDGASVTFGPFPGKQYPVKQVTITDGELQVGYDKEHSPGIKNETVTAGLNGLQLNAFNSDVFVGSGFQIGGFQLGLRGSKLTMGKDASLSTITGFVSEDSHLDIDGAHLKKMTGLQVK